MPTRLIRHRDLVRVSWKNGGGTTAEVAVSPEGAGFDAFDWRVSMAAVASDGPFSTFPGIDRTLVLIEGQGIELTVEGTAHRLDASCPLLSFAGESATTARLIAGPIRDLNVMSRRGRFAHAVALLAPGTTDLPPCPDLTVAVVALTGASRVDLDDQSHTLDRLDGLMTDEKASRIAVDRPSLLVRAWPVRSPPDG